MKRESKLFVSGSKGSTQSVNGSVSEGSLLDDIWNDRTEKTRIKLSPFRSACSELATKLQKIKRCIKLQSDENRYLHSLCDKFEEFLEAASDEESHKISKDTWLGLVKILLAARPEKIDATWAQKNLIPLGVHDLKEDDFFKIDTTAGTAKELLTIVRDCLLELIDAEILEMQDGGCISKLYRELKEALNINGQDVKSARKGVDEFFSDELERYTRGSGHDNAV